MSRPTRYPLAWPPGWRRTLTHQRRRAAFNRKQHERGADGQPQAWASARLLTMTDALGRLTAEVRRLGAQALVVSTNVELRVTDGLPKSGRAEPSDPGAAVYFRLQGHPRCLACDTWDRVADNLAAIAAHIDALRRIERYGVGSLDQAFAGYAALPASPTEWWLVLQVPPTATREAIDEAYRRAARQAHPDVGGSDADMSRVNLARAAALAALAHRERAAYGKG
jgi:hypothetical protein